MLDGKQSEVGSTYGVLTGQVSRLHVISSQVSEAISWYLVRALIGRISNPQDGREGFAVHDACHRCTVRRLYYVSPKLKVRSHAYELSAVDCLSGFCGDPSQWVQPLTTVHKEKKSIFVASEPTL